ncbi:MAG: hypothetical protein AB8B91_04885 [Rubripirellula sp.]
MHFATKATLLAAITAATSLSMLADLAADDIYRGGTPLLPVPGQLESMRSEPLAPSSALQPSSDAFILGARSFTIPFTVDASGSQPTEVRLYVANGESLVGQAPVWKLLDRKSPSVTDKQFQFTAQRDGELWFATRTIDATGNPHPDGPIDPQLKVFVDTTKPDVVLEAEADASGRIDATLAINDSTPLKTSQLRYATDKHPQWQKVDSARLISEGKMSFTPVEEWMQLSIQFVATDTAGNQSVVTQMMRRPRMALVDTDRYAGVNPIPVQDEALDSQPAPFHFSPSENVRAQTASSPVIRLDRKRSTNNNVTAVAHGYAPANTSSGSFGAYRGAAFPAQAQTQPTRSQPNATRLPSQPAPGNLRPKLAPELRQVQLPNVNFPTPSLAQNSQPTITAENVAPPAPERTPPGSMVPFGLPSESNLGTTATEAVRSEVLPTPPAVVDNDGIGLNAPQRSPERIPLPTSAVRDSNVPQTAPAPNSNPEAPANPRKSARTPAEAMRPLSEKSAVPMRAESERSDATRRYEARRSIESAKASRAPVRYSDSERFSLEYELQAIGSLGAEAIELYGSVDGGKSWDFWGRDPDRVSPFDIETREEGVFAYRIVVVGRNGLASPRPLAGDIPDIVVVVDKAKPTVRITGAQYGEGDRIGALVIQYECQDANLMQRPIALSFSDSLQGPWTTVAGGLRNDGDYVWPADPQLPRQIYLRIDATDQAGNVGTYMLDKPIDTQGLAPRARIRGFQTLSGNRPLPTNQKTANRPQANFK